MKFFSDLFSGKFSDALGDLEGGIAALPAEVKAYIEKVESDEYQQVVLPACQLAVQDVVAGNFSTASFIKAGKDVVALAATKGISIIISDALAVLNNLAAPLQPVPVVEVDPNPEPAAASTEADSAGS